MSTEKVHYSKTEKSSKTYQVFYQDELILESNEVVKLKEHYDGKDFPAVIYFPNLSGLETSKTELSTKCKIKGDASYWTYREAEDGIWSYEDPTEEAIEIKGHYTFNQKKGFRVDLNP